MVNCEVLGMEESFQGTCFGHTFFKACQCGIAKEKNSKNLNIFLLSQINLIYESAYLGQRNMEKRIRME